MIKKLFCISLLSANMAAFAQQIIPLNDLSAFKKTETNWLIAGGVSADPNKDNAMETSAGSGVLACIHPHGQYGSQFDLLSVFQHGDLDLSLDFMMAKGSNSGIYLQGRYEIQLLDSWTKKNPSYADLGGVYERWNDTKPDGEKGYEGYAPTSNAAKAPGLWQNIKISFQAPKFDAAGKKTANGKILSVILNGILVQQNVTLTGPTRGFDQSESAMGSLRIQGDHGSVAFRNLQIKNFNQASPTISDLSYKTYEGNIRKSTDLLKLTPLKTSKMDALTWEVLSDDNNFGMTLTGKLNVPSAGKYTVQIGHGGTLAMNINGKEVFKEGWLFTENSRTANVELNAGENPFDLVYFKTDGWMQPRLVLSLESDNVRRTALNAPSSGILPNPTNPILVQPIAEPIVHRSFMDYKAEPETSKRVVHSVSVGNKEGMHFTYDLDNGNLFQVWRGAFLDATAMWNNRGDGTAKPLGAVLNLGLSPSIMTMTDATTPWAAAMPADFVVKGYELDAAGQPTFKYQFGNAMVQDKIIPSEDAKAFSRKISIATPQTNVFYKLAEGAKIDKIAEGLYRIDDAFYVTAINANIRTSTGKQELIAPLITDLNYSISW